MTEPYYIMHNPLTFNLMEFIGTVKTPLDMLSVLSNKNASNLSVDNYTDFLSLDFNKRRVTLVETFGVESYAAQYIANQISNKAPGAKIVLTDGKRRTLEEVINERGKPRAVFMTSMSANFPTTVAQTIALNHGKIPVVLGGIHISASNEDVNTFIKQYIPNKDILSVVTGPGDSDVIEELLRDISQNTLKSNYSGKKSIENRVWGSKNVEQMPSMKIDFFTKIPVFGRKMRDNFKINTTTPYLGCPYSCNFCSISSLTPDQRKFTSRDSTDFINELSEFQKGPVSLQNRYFFFLPDNLMLGKSKLENILDDITDSDLKLNYFTQISIDVADREDLLEKLRLAGATNFFIGLESLNLENLDYIGKNCVREIKRSDLSVAQYYSKKIRKIQNYGISVIGSFIFGLPFDYFNSLKDNSGKDVSQFCIDNNIGLQPNCLTDLPGSRCFSESQQKGNYIYGKKGTIDYLLSLPACDFSETNRVPPESLFKSPLILSYMAYDAIKRVGSARNSLKDVFYMGIQAWRNPTNNGRKFLKERLIDSTTAAFSQIGSCLYKELAENIIYSGHTKGIFERLYEAEKNPEVKKIFKNFVKQYY